jgi:hypothetical protein
VTSPATLASSVKAYAPAPCDARLVSLSCSYSTSIGAVALQPVRRRRLSSDPRVCQTWRGGPDAPLLVVTPQAATLWTAMALQQLRRHRRQPSRGKRARTPRPRRHHWGGRCRRHRHQHQHCRCHRHRQHQRWRHRHLSTLLRLSDPCRQVRFHPHSLGHGYVRATRRRGTPIRPPHRHC